MSKKLRNLRISNYLYNTNYKKNFQIFKIKNFEQHQKKKIKNLLQSLNYPLFYNTKPNPYSFILSIHSFSSKICISIKFFISSNFKIGSDL